MAGAFPSACGKTNLAMLIPTLPGWKVETIGDDIAWMKFGAGRAALRDQPGGGLLRRRAGHRRGDEPQRDGDRPRNSIFTNCALTDDGDVWWEGMTPEPPAHADRLARRRLDARLRDAGRASQRALHDARRAVPVDRGRVGGPGRRADRRDPVRRPPRDRRAARARGLRLGARRLPRLDHGLGDDRRRRRRGGQAALRPVRDAAVLRLPHGRLLRPLARDRRRGTARSCRRLFYVNWFRKDADGKFLWPGFGENSRVLAWIFRRCDGQGRRGRDADRAACRPRTGSTPRAST